MSDSTASPADPPALASAASASTAPTSAAPAAALPPAGGWLAAGAQLAGGLGIGSVITALLILMAPVFNYTLPVAGFDLGSVLPELVVLGSVGLALIAQLRPFAWLIAAGGLFGLAGLYAQGDRLDASSLLVLMVLVMSLQFGGLLLAIASANSRWAIALGLGLGVTVGHDAVLLWVRANADAVAFAGVAVILVAVGVLLLLTGRRPAPPARSRIPWWLVVAVGGAGVLAVALTRIWQAVLLDRTQSFIGGIAESDAAFWGTTDRLIRFAIAAAVTAVLVVVAQRRLPAGAARVVVVASGLAVAI